MRTAQKKKVQDIYQLKCFNKQIQCWANKKMGPGNKRMKGEAVRRRPFFSTPAGCVTQVTEHSEICYLLC